MEWKDCKISRSSNGWGAEREFGARRQVVLFGSELITRDFQGVENGVAQLGRRDVRQHVYRVPEFFEAKEARMVRIAESGSGGQREQTIV